MLELIVLAGLVAGTGCWILYPLFKPDQYTTTPVSKMTETIRHLEAKKENAYAAIRELEFDLSMGKLSKTDFEALKRQYRADAVRLIEEMDRLQPGAETDETTPEAGSESQAKGKIIVLPRNRNHGAQPVFCVQCGAEVSIPGRFCHRCGEKLVDVSQEKEIEGEGNEKASET